MFDPLAHPPGHTGRETARKGAATGQFAADVARCDGRCISALGLNSEYKATYATAFSAFECSAIDTDTVAAHGGRTFRFVWGIISRQGVRY